MRRGLFTLAAVVLLLAAAPVSAQMPGNLILQVPDWNQPLPYGVGGYPGWCSPTAGANLMGYWEDVMGCVGLTDRQAFNASPAYPNTAGTWQQGLYHDGTIEMGWHMNTGSWQNQGPPPNFPPNAGSTARAKIGPGLLSYATSAWTDDSYGPNPGTGIVKVAYPNTSWFMHDISMIGTQITLQQMWTTYCGEIDVARPVEVTFDKWVNPLVFNGTMTITGFPNVTAEMYPWDVNTDPHSVVGVGYIDISPAFMGSGMGDEWFVCQDGWPGPGAGGGGTGRYVAVPLDSMWMQNDYITDVPEPATLLLVLGGLAMLRRRR